MEIFYILLLKVSGFIHIERISYVICIVILLGIMVMLLVAINGDYEEKSLILEAVKLSFKVDIVCIVISVLLLILVPYPKQIMLDYYTYLYKKDKVNNKIKLDYIQNIIDNKLLVSDIVDGSFTKIKQ